MTYRPPAHRPTARRQRYSARTHDRYPGRPASQPEDDMCPNCVTPWKCNGPHLTGEDPGDIGHEPVVTE